MKKFILILMTLFMSVLLFSCNVKEDINKKTIVVVGVVPQATFVNKVSMGNVETVVLIPPGYSPANYQPSSREMQILSDADIYFTLQMPTEEANILPKIKNFNKDIKIINLREIVSEIYPLIYVNGHDHEAEHDDDDEDELSVDPHLWLSPKRSVVMVQSIADELSKFDPVNENTYQKNAADYIKQIESLDEEIILRLANLDRRAFMIYHGSYGYFADDYNLEMISIEVAGKQATPSEIEDVIEHALEEKIKIIFYQEEFDDNQAQTIAEEIGGKVVQVSPLSENYLQAMRDFIYALEHQED
ncbi:MAG: zinc ABC transporter substrate-binding protein [Clostridiales bacterium]|nr:zinc ABC transporter substrate-binding protein [Clostridiales bacterium]